MNRTFTEINTADVTIKDHVRENIGNITTLENSIKKLGILCPIIIDRNNILISGERRLTASRNLELPTIPALKLDIDFNSMTALDIQSGVNLCRQPLSPGDLDKLIDNKKSVMSEDSTNADGFFAKLKKVFS